MWLEGTAYGKTDVIVDESGSLSNFGIISPSAV